MDESHFRIIFDGTLTGEYDEASARANFAALFGIPEKKAARYFTGKPRVIKSDLSEQEAIDYMIRVAETGCECYMEEVIEEPPVGVAERRADGDRRCSFRREQTDSSKTHERRHRQDRRESIRRSNDRRRFRAISKKGDELPLPLQPYSRGAAHG